MRRCRDAHRPQNVARAEELDKRAMEGRGTDADLAESLAIFWPAYFAEPATAPPFPELDFSVEAYAATFESVHDELPGLAARTRRPRRADAVRARRLQPDARHGLDRYGRGNRLLRVASR